MLDHSTHRQAEFAVDPGPLLIVVVDTEEEFDWSKPFSRGETAVTSMSAQAKAQRIFEKFAIKPTYLIDYPVASQPDGFAPLAEFLAADTARVGAHLHPWVNPPFDEAVSRRNSYPGNLAPALEMEKLKRLGDIIADNLGFQPTIYKAGRYGVGAETATALEALGYGIDMSVVPTWDYSADGGPDFRGFTAHPYWFGGPDRLLEIPLACGFAGALAGRGQVLYERLATRLGMKLHVPGVFARLGLMERIRLTPEGVSLPEQRRLTGAMLAAGQRVFTFTYHSPSLAVGHTPYVQSEADLTRFLAKFEGYFDYFMNELGGRAVTPTELKTLLKPAPASAGSA